MVPHPFDITTGMTFDHIAHQILWISSNVRKFETGFISDEGSESFVCGDPHPMTVLFETLAKREERLNVT